MANTGLISITSSRDVTPSTLVAAFFSAADPTTTSTASNTGGNGDYYTTELRIAERVTLQAGLEPSYAIVSIPMAKMGPGNWDESAYAVAFKKSGPAAKIKLRTRVCVSMRSSSGQLTPLMTGCVVKIAHGIERDDLIVTIHDDRYLLSKVTVFGQAQYDPANSLHGFVANEPCIFNERGFPNCVDTAFGPRFAPTVRFGWTANPQTNNSERFDEPIVGTATAAARYWTVADAEKYLFDMHAAGGSRPSGGGFYSNQRVSDWLEWPEKLGDILTAGANRRLHNVSCEGLNLAAALTTIAQRAGPYQIYCRPGARADTGNAAGSEISDKSTLTFIDLRAPSTGDGVIIPKLYGLALPEAISFDCPSTGYLVESIEDYYDDACIVGDAPVYESLFSTDSADSANYYLEPAWAAADEARFKSYVGAGTGANTEIKFKEACLLWPLVYAAYRIKSGFIAKFSGTKHSAAAVSKVHPRIRPALISGYQQNAGSPRDWIPRPITIEYKRPSDSVWAAATQYDNLQVSADGQYFMVAALRDGGPGMTWHAESGGAYEGAYFVAVKIRATLAVELDWRMSSTGLLASTDKDPNKTAERVEKIPGGDYPMVYTTLAQESDYVDWLRYGSKPVGQQISEEHRQFPDRATEASEFFSDKPATTIGRLPEHAKARLNDVKRIGYSGSVKFPLYKAGWIPGRGVKGVSGSDIPFLAVVSSVIYDQEGMAVVMTQTAPQGVPHGIGQR